ncbi:MAG: hypothetical protein WA215_12520 [Candidatus Cybelea sp.]
MIQLRLGRHASCVGVAVAILTGCGVPRQAQDDMPTPIGATGALPQGRLTHAKMASSSGGDLLYVDQGYTLGKHPRGGVLIYTYPGDALVGQFTVSNPSYPPATTEGICSDAKGDVFIEAEYYYGTTIYEYAHGGTSPIATLGDGGNGYANDCASDPKTGNLAVVSRAAVSSPANVAIFKDAKGKPTTYTDASITAYYSCGYDSQGNLFIDGTKAGGGVEFAELPVGSSTFTNIALDKTLGSTGAVQWDGTYITVDGASAIYRLSISGSTGTVVSTTRVLGRRGPWRALNFIYHNRAIAPDGGERGEVGFWRYPAGGKPVDIIAANGVRSLYSATISVAPNR